MCSAALAVASKPFLSVLVICHSLGLPGRQNLMAAFAVARSLCGLAEAIGSEVEVEAGIAAAVEGAAAEAADIAGHAEAEVV